MAVIGNRVPEYKSSKSTLINWDSFNGGLNTLLKANEIGKNELSQANDMMLIGKGVPTKRWGTAVYFTAGATGPVRALNGFYKSDGTNELLTITDDGYLTKQNGTSYDAIAGASWASGSDVQMAQLNNTMYIVNGQRALTKYSSPTLVGFATIARPTMISATNISNASGSSTKGYKVSAVSQVGETLASTTIELVNQPVTLGGTAGGLIKLQWTGPSTASGILKGYNVYGRDSGNETFLAGVDAATKNYLDDGSAIPSQFTYPPLADSTGGPIAKYVVRFQDRLIYAGISGQPSMLLISGHVPNHEKFDLSFGGNYLLLEPDSGDDITGLATYKDRIIVFKQHSIWQVTLGMEAIGNFWVTIPTPQLITAAYGAISPRSIVFVENDLFFLSERGVHTLGYQFGFSFDQLRANEVSGKIRPYMKDMAIAKKKVATATYYDFKYIISFPGSGETMCYDVLRKAWMGPWSFDCNIITTYIDTDGLTHLLMGRNSGPTIDRIASEYSDDAGTAIQTILSTRKEDFGDWSLFKTIKSIFTQMRNVTGGVSVDIQLEQRNGNTVTAKSATITPATGNSGWGADMWGSSMWGDTNARAASTGSDATDVIRWANINQAARTMQIVIKTTARGDNYELLGVRSEAKPIGSGFRPSSWRL